MRKFIETIVGTEKLNIGYEDYDSLFVRREYDSYCFFFFLKDKSQLITLQREAGDIFYRIKESKLYQPDMDKNITCIFCLSVEENEYYGMGINEEISELNKIICFVEEDLNYFKKNVLLYTEEMEKFAQKNTGKFELLCKEYLTEEYFQKYKKSNKDSIEYDFLINLFIKIPFLSFHEYQIQENKKYQTVETFIEEKCRTMKINQEYINKVSEKLEKIDDVGRLYEWVDTLIEQEKSEDESVTEGTNDED